jgi:type I restriction enzyme S subunit
VEGTKLRFYKGDIIFGRRRAYQRKTALATTDGICSAHAMVLRAKEDIVDPSFFPFLFHSKQFIDMAITISVGGLSPTINWKDISKQEFLLPPKSEQKRLTELLWAADEMIEKEKKELKKNDEFKKYFISSNFLNGNKCISLKDLGTVIRGVSYKPEQVCEKYDSDTFVLLRSNNIDSNFRVNYNEVYYIDSTILKEDQNLCLNDIVICMSNGSKDLVGKAAEITSLNKERISVGSFCAIYRPNNAIAKYLFQSTEYRKQIALLLSGSNINNLKPADIESIKFRIQEREDLKEIILYLEHIDKTTERITLQLRASQQLKQELINKIF